jgi:hypothetical protein
VCHVPHTETGRCATRLYERTNIVRPLGHYLRTPRPSVRVERGIAEGRQAHVSRDARGVGRTKPLPHAAPMPRASTAFTPNTTHGGQPRSRGAPVATTIASSVRCRRSISRSSSAICCSEMAGKRGRSGRIGVTSAIGVQNKLLDLGIFGPTHSREFGPFGILGPTYFLVGSYKETPSRPGHQGVGSAPPEPRRAARRAVIIARERAR